MRWTQISIGTDIEIRSDTSTWKTTINILSAGQLQRIRAELMGTPPTESTKTQKELKIIEISKNNGKIKLEKAIEKFIKMHKFHDFCRGFRN